MTPKRVITQHKNNLHVNRFRSSSFVCELMHWQLLENIIIFIYVSELCNEIEYQKKLEDKVIINKRICLLNLTSVKSYTTFNNLNILFLFTLLLIINNFRVIVENWNLMKRIRAQTLNDFCPNLNLNYQLRIFEIVLASSFSCLYTVVHFSC
jgi:hypothetical protein